MGMTLRSMFEEHTSSSKLSTGSMLLVVEGFSSPTVARTPSETQCRNGLPMAGSRLTETPYMSIRCTDAYSLRKMCCSTDLTVQTKGHMLRSSCEICASMMVSCTCWCQVVANKGAKSFTQRLPVSLEHSLSKALHHDTNEGIESHNSQVCSFSKG